MKLCKDCKWVKPYKITSFICRTNMAECQHPSQFTISPITGDKIKDESGFTYCESVRSEVGNCGEDAKNWEDS